MREAYISCLAYQPVKKYLTDKGYTLHELARRHKPYPAVSSHPDMYMCKAGDRIIHAEPNWKGHYLAYNAVFLDRYLIHNLNFTAPDILADARKRGLELIHVKQGYTKCSCVVVSGNAIITADKGILAAVKGKDIDVLEITAGHVALDGFDYGFLGGASGRVGDSVLFNGSLDWHPDGMSIRRFIIEHGANVVETSGKTLYDIGSIIAVG